MTIFLVPGTGRKASRTVLDDMWEALEVAVCAPVNYQKVVASLGMDTPSIVLLWGPAGFG